MKTPSFRSVLLVLVPAVITFLVGPVLWPMAHGPEPTSVQLSFFIALSVIESFAFGVGVWFLAEGKSLLRKPAASVRLTTWTYAAIAWSLMSWWMHDNLHKANGENLQGLLYIEYAFHFTLILAAGVIAAYFLAAQRGANR